VMIIRTQNPPHILKERKRIERGNMFIITVKKVRFITHGIKEIIIIIITNHPRSWF
jgi:hypothetical protein